MNTKTVITPTSLHEKSDLICFSHLRWDFVYQRPQHLLSRFGKHVRTFFIEEPVLTEGPESFNIKHTAEGVYVLVPQLNPGRNEESTANRIRSLLSEVMLQMEIEDYILWYYTPMALKFSNHLEPRMIVYDCMDELSAFKFAPPELKKLEKELLEKADLVFTGGVCLYEHKKGQHHNIHPFPSSIDKEHFAQARTMDEPEDQKHIPHPRFGFYGVVDERFDIELLDQIATQKPEWQFVILGPVVKIDPETLPKHQNIHYLGGRSYKELPAYLAGWDVAIIPFARNESTRFISPTKTPEYLAAGKPVISTSITDVVEPYGKNRLVEIADTSTEFINAAERILVNPEKQRWLQEVDSFLANNSWDNTWAAMVQLMNETMNRKTSLTTKKTKEAYV